jgi:hypothetical protein
MEKHKFIGSGLYNTDGTGISIIQTASKILGLNGQKQLGSATAGKEVKHYDLYGHERCWQFRASHVYFFPAKNESYFGERRSRRIDLSVSQKWLDKRRNFRGLV